MSEAITKALQAAEVGLANLVSYQSSANTPSIHEFGQARRALDGVRAALSQPAPLAGEVTDEQIETWSFWEEFPGYLINNYEGITITEEVLQQAASGLYAKLKAEGRAIPALRPQSQPAGFVAGPLVWNPRQSEAVIKVTREAQPEHGFTHPIYAEPQAALRPQAVPMIPLGFRVSHNPDWCALTDEVNAGSRWTVERNDAPYEGASRKRMWKGRTLADAMAAALADLGITAKAEGGA